MLKWDHHFVVRPGSRPPGGSADPQDQPSRSSWRSDFQERAASGLAR
jgi:hypothetical protein